MSLQTQDIICRSVTHSFERVHHWAVVFCFLFTAISGLDWNSFFPSFNWLMNIFGTPQLSRILHPRWYREVVKPEQPEDKR